MKVLFLDVDGVLNCTYTFQRRNAAYEGQSKSPLTEDDLIWPMGHLDEQIIPLLNPIVERTDCKIVVSSSWRLHSRFTELGSWLKIKGFKYPEVIIDKTSCMPMMDNCRGEEIKEWLRKHPEVQQYVIIDDDGEDIIPVHPNNYIFTNGNEGLTNEKVEAVISILNQN